MRQATAFSLAFALVAGPLASAPAVAQVRAEAGRAPTIGSLQVTTDTGLRAGSQLSFRLEGSPGAEGQVTVGRQGPQVQLHETSPGVYVGQYVIPRAAPVAADADLRASLDDGRHSASTRFRMPPSLASANGYSTAAARRDHSTARSDTKERQDRQQRQAASDLQQRQQQLAQTMGRPGPATPGAGISSGQSVLGSAPAALPLQLTSPRQAVGGGQDLEVAGTTAPFALVRVRVDAIPAADQGRYVVARQIEAKTVQSDRQGRFHVSVDPGSQPAGTRYQVHVTAAIGSDTAERLVVVNQGG